MNIYGTHDCYGCGVCAIACHAKIIKIVLNQNGFYEPQIEDIEACTDCGLCISVCSYAHKELASTQLPINSYAGWSKDEIVRNVCSSGGIGYDIAKYLLEKGYHVCGVRFNTHLNQAEHFVAKNEEELIETIGSKYIQSYTVEGFQSVNRKDNNLIIGTPCQIDSFRRYIRKFHCEENFILMDFFCHGVPSKLLWDKYYGEINNRLGKISYVSWRNKETGWHDSWSMSFSNENNLNWNNVKNLFNNEKNCQIKSKFSKGDLFFKFFLNDSCLGKACYERCKFKYDKSSADIRIGDLWGKEYKNDENGVSAVIAFTEKGNKILQECNSTLTPLPFEIVAEGQMKKAPQKPLLYDKLMRILRGDRYNMLNFSETYAKYKKQEKIKWYFHHPLSFIKAIVWKLTRQN